MPRLRAWFKKRKIAILPIGQLAKADVLVVLGGDGTILSVAPRAAVAGVPVLGVNTGQIGFLASTQLKSLYQTLDAWAEGRWVVHERMMLEVQPPKSRQPDHALNDAVIRLKSITRVTNIIAYLNGEKLAQFTGDGVIVATTTGSTAYSLAAQGPVVHPDVDAIILTPICAHSFAQRPMVFPADYNLDLELADRRGRFEVQLCLDGQRVISLQSGDRVRVRRSPYKLKLLQSPQASYFRTLREKLNWGGR